MKEIDLSFCIPTYNRAAVVHKLVTDILLCPDPSIEVVVLDNGSTDHTLSILHGVDDRRLSVYSNGENKGFLYNVLHAIDSGRGRFVVFSTDKDHVDPAEISDFKVFLLRNPQLACGYCEYQSASPLKAELYKKGFNAVEKIGYVSHHPSGYFFNNALLKSVNLVERFWDQDFVDIFPLDFVFAELCLLGDGAVYHRPLFEPEEVGAAAHQKSFSTKGNNRQAFFSPAGRLKLAVNFSLHANTLALPKHQKESLIADRLLQGIGQATVGYRSIMKNPGLCTHYHMEPEEIGARQMFAIATKFYKDFFLGIAEVLMPGMLSRRAIDANLAVAMCGKIWRRVFGRST